MLNSTKNWTAVRAGLLIVALIPVTMFLLVVGNVIWNSRMAIATYGLGNFFSAKISGPFSAVYTPGQYGLYPAMLGTLLVVLLALVIAFPFSLTLAVAATEFSMGWLGRPIELLLSIFSGIPDIIYALLSVFVVTSFIRPKFAGIQLADSLIATLPGFPKPMNAGTLPLNQSTLLGGIFLALLIIPFMAPLILDAIRNVPQQLKEASLALGATRWFTLRRVILPGALNGVVAAVTIGLLKASGDVVISSWTIGFIKDNGLPNPLWDIFERNAPLTSTGAGLVGGLYGASPSMGPGFSAASFSALLLLVFAFAIIGLANLTRRWLSRRYQS